VEPFFGRHQGGVVTPSQEHVLFAAFDLLEDADRRDLVSVLRDWSAAAARLTQGLPVTDAGALGGDPESPPEDTGETQGLGPGRLTVTIGFGPGLFGHDGVDRFGLGAARPPDLAPLPAFPGDMLDPAWTGGDLGVQVCADDPQVCFHAVRSLARLATHRAMVRWSQPGFLRATGSTPAPAGPAHGTPRNLLGFKDGTGNISITDDAELDRHVWVAPNDAPSWLAGGSYLVVRRIQLLIEAWDRETLASQQAVFGRSKGEGGPLSGGTEFAAPDFRPGVDGTPAIDKAAHVRLAHPTHNGGIRILRRGFNYVAGMRPDGCIDAGLLFLAYQRSPGSFIALQRALAADALNEYIRPVGSAIFAVPPGAGEGGFVGETLLG
jgi:deferrochelatase/peroxidase EfeB